MVLMLCALNLDLYPSVLMSAKFLHGTVARAGLYKRPNQTWTDVSFSQSHLPEAAPSVGYA